MPNLLEYLSNSSDYKTLSPKAKSNYLKSTSKSKPLTPDLMRGYRKRSNEDFESLRYQIFSETKRIYEVFIKDYLQKSMRDPEARFRFWKILADYKRKNALKTPRLELVESLLQVLKKCFPEEDKMFAPKEAISRAVRGCRSEGAVATAGNLVKMRSVLIPDKSEYQCDGDVCIRRVISSSSSSQKKLHNF